MKGSTDSTQPQYQPAARVFIYAQNICQGDQN